LYTALVGKVMSVVEKMPLWKLQTVAAAPLTFLYRSTGKSHEIELLPGVMFCFRKFYNLISDLVRGAWVGFVRGRNGDILGSATDLEEFLFGSVRASLVNLVPFLGELQEMRCFYCGRSIKTGCGHVDHFIPWSKYAVDLGHNFVLAHSQCNSAKAQHIASTEHLSNWINRNTAEAGVLATEFNKRRIAYDRAASIQIARWAYAGTAAAGGLTWLRGKEFRLLPRDWEELFPEKIR
jgi:hypothetical protein